jgi:hypothetical protein
MTPEWLKRARETKIRYYADMIIVCLEPKAYDSFYNKLSISDFEWMVNESYADPDACQLVIDYLKENGWDCTYAPETRKFVLKHPEAPVKVDVTPVPST